MNTKFEFKFEQFCDDTGLDKLVAEKFLYHFIVDKARARFARFNKENPRGVFSIIDAIDDVERELGEWDWTTDPSGNTDECHVRSIPIDIYYFTNELI